MPVPSGHARRIPHLVAQGLLVAQTEAVPAAGPEREQNFYRAGSIQLTC